MFRKKKKGVGSRSVVETSCAAPWTAQGGCRDHYLSYLCHVIEVGVGPGPVDGPKGSPLGLHHLVVPAAGSWVRWSVPDVWLEDKPTRVRRWASGGLKDLCY
ncbi:unnamed protein product [Citrullus colocynthis]|uniref:Uncharacterized protein n=1 Tax=Citrullus colocynthis TaxID=252529 RepID=A0ABP0Z6T0_9ROSI